MSGFLGLLVTDLRLSDLASEASSHSGVDTSLLSPRSLSHSKNATLINQIYTESLFLRQILNVNKAETRVDRELMTGYFSLP